MTRVLEVITTGGSSRKAIEPTTDHVSLPQLTHGQDMEKSHKLCPKDWAPWVISLFLLLFCGLEVEGDGVYFLYPANGSSIRPQNPSKPLFKKTVLTQKSADFIASHQKTSWSKLRKTTKCEVA